MIAMTTQTHAFTLPAIRAPQQCACVLDADRIVSALAQGLGLPGFLSRAISIAAFEREASQLDTRTAVHPVLRIRSARHSQIRHGLIASAKCCSCGAALVSPQCLLAGNPGTLVVREHCQAFVQQVVCLLSAPGAKRRGPGFEPEQPVSWKQSL